MNKSARKKRGSLYSVLGRQFHIVKRHCRWRISRVKFARVEHDEITFYYEYFKHSTPLVRNLQEIDVTMQENKQVNLRLAAEKINQVVIRPGETFSFWKLVGKPIHWKGYKESLILCEGTYKRGIGGGLSQLSNLIYWMALHTPLTIVERHRHTYDVFPDSNRKLPFGSGATCVYNFKDLVLKNETKIPFQINVWLTKERLCGDIKADVVPIQSYHVYEKNHIIVKEPLGGYSRNNTIYRAVYNMDGEQIADEFIAENHARMMYEPLIENRY